MPKLKDKHERSNREIAERQQKIIDILRSERSKLDLMSRSPNSLRSPRRAGGTSTQKSVEREYNRDLSQVSIGSPFGRQGIFMTDGGSASKINELDFAEQRIDTSPSILNPKTPGQRKLSYNPKLMTPNDLELETKMS